MRTTIRGPNLTGMYVPRANAVTDDSAIRSFVRDVGVAEVVTVGDDGYPLSTLLPVVWEGDRVIAHFARANKHWEQIADRAPTLLIVRGAHAYVSPNWYPAKHEHGRAVPTWNYSAVQLRGRARVFRDAEGLLDAVTLLTNMHEGEREEPWAVDDAPPDYIDGMLKAIVGIEIAIEHVDAKAKLSQNRSDADRRSVIAGLCEGDDRRGEHQVAAQMLKSFDR